MRPLAAAVERLAAGGAVTLSRAPEGYDAFVVAELARGFNLPIVLDDGDDFAAVQRGHVKNHQSQRAAADHGHSVAGMRATVLKAMHRAGQRLGQRRVLQRHVLRHKQRILGHNARRNADELRISAVVEEQIVAQVLLAMRAEITLPAGCGVQRDYAVAGGKALGSLTNLDDSSGLFMAKERRRHNHARVIAPPEDLQVGSAGERRVHADDQLTGFGFGNGNLLDADIFAAVENGSLHGVAAVQ